MRELIVGGDDLARIDIRSRIFRFQIGSNRYCGKALAETSHDVEGARRTVTQKVNSQEYILQFLKLFFNPAASHSSGPLIFMKRIDCVEMSIEKVLVNLLVIAVSRSSALCALEELVRHTLKRRYNYCSPFLICGLKHYRTDVANPV